MSDLGIAVRAAVFRRLGEPLSLEEIVVDAPHEGEVRVRLAACAICHSDLSFLKGEWKGSLPAVLGHEAAGVVEEVGPGAVGLELGDHVVVTLVRHCGRCYLCAGGEPALCRTPLPIDGRHVLRSRDGEPIKQGLRTGGFAEQVTVHASQVVPIPREVPLDRACLLACGVLTGVGAVTRTAGARAGDSVVVIGVGGVGMGSVLGARLVGAHPIVAVDVAQERLARALALGATHGLDPAGVDLAEAVRDLTGGRGADYVVVAAGAKAAIEEGFRLTRRGGTLVVAGMPPEGVTIELDPLDLAHDGRRVLGSKMGSARPAVDIPWLASLYLQGRLELDELISGRYPLERIEEAVRLSLEGRGLRHVIVF